MPSMTEHKSNLKALEPVEIRLAAAVRVRYEIARLREVEAALDSSAHEIAVSVVGSEFADVVLKVVGSPFEGGPDLFDQSAVEAFLAEHHELRLGTAALVAPPSSGVPSAGSAEASRQPAGVPQPDTSGPPSTEGEAPSAAAAVAARLSAYDVELPEDYCGVSFDMIKRPEANLIMGEAVLAVIDGSTLDASPYKADRGKVHWRRKLFEETFLRFEANPPRPKSAPEQEQAEAQEQAQEQVEERAEEREPVDAVADETSPTATDRVDLAPALEPAATSSGIPTQAPATDPASVPAAAAVQASEITSQAMPTPQHPEPTSSRGEAGNPSTSAPTVAAPEIRPSATVGQAAPAGDGRSGMPAFDQARPVPASGQIIEFPGAPNAHQDAVDADDILDPFESALPSRTAMADAGLEIHASDVGSDEADEADGDPAGGEDETPTYEGPEWEGPSEEAEADLNRTMDDRIHYDPREHGPAEAGAMRTGGLDPAAAAALAEAAAPPVVEEREASRLPVGGVPPRPPIPMPTVRPAPAAPPRPAVAPPGSPGTAAPPPRPALSGTGEGGRLAPRPVAVRPPGL
jgi:hypothetical protein